MTCCGKQIWKSAIQQTWKSALRLQQAFVANEDGSAGASPYRAFSNATIELFIRPAAIALLFLANSVIAKADSKLPSDNAIQAVLTKCVAEQNRAPGIVIGVVDSSGARVFARGTIDYDDPKSVTGDSVFEIGSASKVFTALLLEEMVENGEVKLDDPVGKYLPASIKVPSRNGREITLVDLATQTSGLPRLPDNLDSKDFNNPYADYTADKLYEYLSQCKLTRDIGSKYEYSNLAVGLLGHALALRAKSDYENAPGESHLQSASHGQHAHHAVPGIESAPRTGP